MKPATLMVNLFFYAFCFHITKGALEGLATANAANEPANMTNIVDIATMLAALAFGWMIDSYCVGMAMFVSQIGCLLVYGSGLATVAAAAPAFYMGAKVLKSLQHCMLIGKCAAILKADNHKQRAAAVAGTTLSYYVGMVLAKVAGNHIAALADAQTALIVGVVCTLLPLGHTWFGDKSHEEETKKAGGKKAAAPALVASPKPFYTDLLDKHFVTISIVVMMATVNKWTIEQTDLVVVKDAPWATCPIPFRYIMAILVSAATFGASFTKYYWNCKCCGDAAQDCLVHLLPMNIIYVAITCCCASAGCNCCATVYQILSGLNIAGVSFASGIWLAEAVPREDLGRVAALAYVVGEVVSRFVAANVMSFATGWLTCLIPCLKAACAGKLVVIGGTLFIVWFLFDAEMCKKFHGECCFSKWLPACCSGGAKKEEVKKSAASEGNTTPRGKKRN